MRFVRAACLGVLVAAVGGVIAGVREYLVLRGGSDAGARGSIYAESIAVALNCAALFALVCVPLALVVHVVRSVTSGRGRGTPG